MWFISFCFPAHQASFLARSCGGLWQWPEVSVGIHVYVEEFGRVPLSCMSRSCKEQRLVDQTC